MQPVKDQPRLVEYQQYVREAVVERGLEKGGVLQGFMFSLEECNGLSKAVCKFVAAKKETRGSGAGRETGGHEVEVSTNGR